MNSMKMHIMKQNVRLFRLIYNKTKFRRCFYHNSTVESVDVLDNFTDNLIKRHKKSIRTNPFDVSDFDIHQFVYGDSKTVDLLGLSEEELNNTLLQLISKNKDKQIEEILVYCNDIQKIISDFILKVLYRHYSNAGKSDMVVLLQQYCEKVVPNLHKRYGEFTHYLAKAQCLKGNSDKGLSILKDSYNKNEHLRSLYRVIFRELIQDSVLNRSEASLVVFKKYVLEFSKLWEDHYPMICFWHICWSSSWYSDQMLSNELLDSSETLQKIVMEKATALSISILKHEYNEDAVVRLLQILLKYHMMTEYAKVLQVLFSYKLRNRDLRGCTEIIRNCEVLGVTLPSDQQGQYIKMLINGKSVEPKPSPAKSTSKHFKLQF